jgi:hypothetical protein
MTKKTQAKVSKKIRKQELTPRQRKLVKLEPKVKAGELTRMDAMRKAGYSEESSRQQANVYGALRNNTRMQEALRQAGFTEEYLATGVVDGTKATAPVGNKTVADYKARGIYYKLGAELLDAFPATKTINTDVTIADLIKSQEAA